MFAVAEFGSACRGAIDRASDRDLLVVAPRNQLAEHRNRFSERGFSVTALDAVQITTMEQHGSLFLQHLKAEARIWFDLDGEFSCRLENAESVPAPQEELERSQQALQFVTELRVPSSLRSWQADVMYCLSRDLVIKLASRTRHPIYGVDSIDAASRSDLGLSREGLVALRHMRVAKSRHRRRQFQSEQLDDVIASWKRELESLIGLHFETRECRFDPISLLDRECTSNYERIRGLEAAALLCEAKGVSVPNAPQTWALVTRLNEYREIRSTMKGTVKDQLEAVVAALV